MDEDTPIADEEQRVLEIEEHILATPPRCIRGFRLKSAELPIEFDDNFRTVWDLACSCGEAVGALLGHSLGDFNPEYEGREIFISPLGFECSCGKVTEFFDTDEHGEHAEIARVEGGVGSANLRGEGSRKRYPCPSCRGERFTLRVAFIYWDFDLHLDEEELIAEGVWRKEDFSHPEDFFNVFLSFARCSNCGELSEPTEFGKL